MKQIDHRDWAIRMRALFIPARTSLNSAHGTPAAPTRTGAVSHGFPLLALSRKANSSGIKTSFLLPKVVHDLFRREGANVLDIDHESLRTEMIAYSRFQPDVVIDDLSVTTAVASELSGVPRVTVRRTGLFPEESRNLASRHSADFEPGMLKEFAMLGLEPPADLIDLVKAEAFIIPGIRSIEALPAAIQNDARYFYAGPLVISDVFPSIADKWKLLNDLDAFLTRHEHRRVVFVTFGNVAAPSRSVQVGLYQLMQHGFPVVSTIALDSIPASCEELFYYARFLPFHYICARASLMIHHCGSGTYQFPILYGMPSITIATGYYDRDEVARRLQSLGASIHLQYDGDEAGFVDRLLSAACEYLVPASEHAHRCRRVLAELKSESERTSEAFSLDELLRHVLRQTRAAGTRPQR